MGTADTDTPFVVLAAVLLVLLAGFATSTLFVSAPFVGDWVIFVGGLGAILTGFAFVLSDAWLRTRRKRRGNLRFDLLSRKERRFVFGGIALLVALAASAVPSIAAGQPIREGGRYFANDHGTLTPISRAAYERGIVGAERFFTGGAAVFVLVALAGFRARARERSS